ncbi:hypothetical protein NA57DRAFT_65448 [Rhizodiscina lignyota]|uniref:TAFII55 protein conserved region domain-containing protein n=1 Tax=Rhizodiscina lignyota TaxID=1504668 RepID=A0A9P4M6I4_9PEZI|nr:hypothetical protein NA57DRAFT_65448 [Rhizodiscina lignyota]
MKISFKPKGAVAPTPTSEVPPTPGSSGPKITFTIKTPATEQAPQADKKPKRAYTKKPKPDVANGATPAKTVRKRKAEDGGATTPAKRPKGRPPQKPRVIIPSGPIPGTGAGGQPVMLKFSAKPVQTPRIKMKHVGSMPVRPIGVGYDSEDSEAEPDPSIEAQFILRMQPGEDCDYLREAIDEKKIGLKPSEGGADVSMVFFDKEGRRGMVTIRGNHYAAILVDLPCVIEATKSWDKKNWMKSADICQMLLVIGQVKNEEEAKTAPLPPEIDKESFQYPHGLTPPMHLVRKRRFRKRVSYRTIEAVETEVSRLLDLDQKVKDAGGKVDIEVIDLAKLRQESEQPEEEEEEMDEMEYHGAEADMEDYFGDQADAEADAEGDAEGDAEDDLAQLMEAEFEMDDGEDETANAALSIETAAQHAIQNANGAVQAAETPSASGAETTDADGDDGDDDDDDDGEEMDEDEIAAQQELLQQQEELKTLEQELAAAKAGLEAQTNPLLKQRAKAKVQSLQADLELKKAALGIE